MSFTAIVLSAKPVTLEIPGVVVLGRTQTLKSPTELHAARLDALREVKTPLCFFLDDDDALPDDYISVLDECAERMRTKGVLMAYTDELDMEQGKAAVRRSWYEYDRRKHRDSPMGLHHLVVMRTSAAQQHASTLPRGEFWTEHMLYWSIGEGGAIYVPRVGYHWRRKATGGFSRDPRTLTALVRTQRWIAQKAEP